MIGAHLDFIFRTDDERITEKKQRKLFLSPNEMQKQLIKKPSLNFVILNQFQHNFQLLI
jgi:hypothetical protein